MYEDLVAKQDVFRFQVDDEDRARLARLAKHYNLTPSAVVRMLVKRDDDAVTAASRALGLEPSAKPEPSAPSSPAPPAKAPKPKGKGR